MHLFILHCVHYWKMSRVNFVKEAVVWRAAWSLVVVFVLENINYVCIENPPFNYDKMQTRIKYEDDLCVVVAASPRREHNSKLSGA